MGYYGWGDYARAYALVLENGNILIVSSDEEERAGRVVRGDRRIDHRGYPRGRGLSVSC
jgi:hypothetical protein